MVDADDAGPCSNEYMLDLVRMGAPRRCLFARQASHLRGSNFQAARFGYRPHPARPALEITVALLAHRRAQMTLISYS